MGRKVESVILSLVLLFRLWLVFLVTTTLLWGGCQSCPRFFMFPWEDTNSADKHCCSKAGRCSRPAGKTQPESSTSGEKTCKRITLESAEKFSLAVPVYLGLSLFAPPQEVLFFGFSSPVFAANSPPGESSFSILRI